MPNTSTSRWGANATYIIFHLIALGVGTRWGPGNANFSIRIVGNANFSEIVALGS